MMGNVEQFHPIRGTFSYPLLESAYRSCCFGLVEPNKIVASPNNIDRISRLDSEVPITRFHNADLVPNGEIDNNTIWILVDNLEDLKKQKRNPPPEDGSDPTWKSRIESRDVSCYNCKLELD